MTRLGFGWALHWILFFPWKDFCNIFIDKRLPSSGYFLHHIGSLDISQKLADMNLQKHQEKERYPVLNSIQSQERSLSQITKNLIISKCLISETLLVQWIIIQMHDLLLFLYYIELCWKWKWQISISVNQLITRPNEF